MKGDGAGIGGLGDGFDGGQAGVGGESFDVCVERSTEAAAAMGVAHGDEVDVEVAAGLCKEPEEIGADRRAVANDEGGVTEFFDERGVVNGSTQSEPQKAI